MAKKSLLSRLNPRLKWRGVRGIRYNENGVSAVEFALIAPLLLLMYLGAIELSLLMRVDRRVTSTSASLGDLTARLTVATDSDMRELFAAAEVMMQPYSARSARMRITSIVDDGDGKARVAWSDAYLMTPYSKGAKLSVPDGIMSSPGSVILSEVEYTYDGALGGFLTNGQVMRSQFYLRPRRVSELKRLTGGGSPFGPTS